MRRLLLTTGFVAIATWLAWAQTRTGPVLFEGARLVTGEPRAPLDDSAFLVDAGRITAVGARGTVKAPPGTTVIDLRGKTVMPALVDAHSHLGYTDVRTGQTTAASYTRDNLLDHLRRYAYYGIAATASLGLDRGELPYELRAMPTPGAALFLTAGRGIAMPNAGPNAGVLEGCGVRRHDRGRRAGRGARAGREESGPRQDLGGRPEQDGHTASTVAVSADHRGGTRARPSRRRARVLPGRCERAASRRHRRLRARDP